MPQPLRSVFIFIAALLSIFGPLRLQTAGQVRPVYDQGSLGVGQFLGRLNTNASALMIGAHPDDEDTALLAYLARGEYARTAYLSLTRGDGGQNIIGQELGEALGVIRTEELLQARRLDGAEQFFTRAYDYGFSKTLAEAKEKWDEKVILCDVVHVIRGYRPLVVIAQFSGTGADGHGQHQFAGYIAPIAVKAAADPAQCREAGPVWTVKKVYLRHRGQGEPTLRINTGKYDPQLGRSYFEIAMHARSQHRSQEQGVLELKGDQFSSLTLVSSAEPRPAKEEGLFDGLDVGLPNESFTVDKEPSSEMLAGRKPGMQPDYQEFRLRVLGTRVEVLADRETAVSGESIPVAVRVFTPGDGTPKISKISFNLPAVKTSEPANAPGTFRREVATAGEYFNLTVPANLGFTQPYWLLSPRSGDLFAIPDRVAADQPFGEPAAFADITLEVRGKTIAVRRPVEYRFADDIRGEIRRNLEIVPKIAVAPDQNLLIVSTRSKQARREVSVSLTNNVSGAASGSIRLILPSGWSSTPAESQFSMARKGESASVPFAITIPRTASAGSFEIKAEAVMNGESFSQTMQTIAYEHIQTHRIYRPARIAVRLIDLQTAPVKVGYVRGSGDRVQEAIKQLGIAVEEIDESTLASGDLSRFDTIVVGIRAYQVRPDVVANNQRLLDFATKGGTLVVQYQLPPTYSQRNLAPYPTQMGPRVADENAAIAIAEPMHPILNFPNKIAADDFAGWVQERNLYNFVQMDPKYVGLLESHDPGEAENKGGLVVADVGKGKYVYCSYSLFRQLPAGVPGAYRLLANLVSLGAAKRASSAK